MAIQISTVDFHGQPLSVIPQNNQLYVAMKPICENIGLQWRAQNQRIQRDEVLGSTACMIHAVAEDGKNRQLLCLPVEYLNGWLFGVDEKRVKPEIKQRLIQYKRECYKVLSDYWLKGQGGTARQQPNQAIGSEGMKRLSSLVDGKISHLKGKQRASAKARFWNQIHAAFDVKMGMDIPESEFNNARQFISEYVLEGDYLPAEPEQATMPQADAVFSPKRMPSGFDQRHGRLLWEQMFDCGWRIDLLWAVRWIKDHEGQTVLLEPGVSEQLQLELNSILFWNENYRNKLLDIHRMTQIGQRY